MKVYIDPYAAVDYFTVGYKGANPYDAGMFYLPIRSIKHDEDNW